jgi:protein TonB
MARKIIYQKEILNLVFLTRTKEYGAYLLRSSYEKHAVSAMLLSVMIFAAASGLTTLLNKAAPLNAIIMGGTKKTPVTLDNLPIDPKPTIALPKVSSLVSAVSTLKYLIPKITKDIYAENEYMPTAEELSHTAAGTRTVKGNLSADDLGDIVLDEPAISKVVKEAEPATPDIYNYVELMPEFPGGADALLSYLAQNIRYPDMAKRAGIEGRIIAGFIVSKTGAITNISIIKGIGGGCDEEAMRVLKNMPAWKPGKQNGIAVNVRMSVPISFRLR